ncbi:IPT/TIG domain-containing protein [Fibrella sp. WM1]|uniref:IPT/TIG domain-containing protein n=1 Tax=Fibrella musci TaxID=3242485 RepID=UPI003520B4BC
MNRLSLIVVLLLVSLTACEKKKYPPQLTAVSPSRAPIFDEVVLTGSQFGDNPTVLFGGEVADILSQSESRLTVEVPYMSLGATTVRVQNADGSSDPLPFTVQQPLPYATDLTPSSGRVGSTVLIEGSFLNGVTEVRFGGGTSSPASFQQVGDAIRATVPANSTTGTICLRNAAGVNCSFRTFTIDIPQPAPVIGGLSPSQGVGGTEITISGQNLQSVQEVKIGGQTVAARSNTSTSLKVTAPTFSSLADVAVTVRTSGGTSNAWNFKGAPTPSIDKARCVPTGLIPGSALTLKGSHFNTVSEVWVGNAAVPASQFIRSSADEITLKVPAGVTNSDVNVRIVNQYGTHAGENFALVTSGSGLNTGNVGTGSTTPILSYQSDACRPNYFLFCYNGKWVKYYVDNNPLTGAVGCETGIFYTTSTLGGSAYNVYTERYTAAAPPFTLMLELTSDKKQFTGFVVLTAPNGERFFGNVVKSGQINAGDIIAMSPTTGTVVRLCALRNEGSSQYISGQACSVCK